MSVIPKYKATGCGCGGSGSGATSASPCDCGGAQCDSGQGQGIVRPRFFAGQLLTEDDLQLLTDYVGHKNRLHNRYLFGAGVVCGLEVTCHPCGDGRVMVHPGYALDCCGNDLTLACAQPLDINAMVRDLRRDQLGGFDCGDPCPEPEAYAHDRSQANAVSDDAGQEAVPRPPQPRLRYCLYLRYSEQQSDPVMPYSTGDECGRVGCEATRVREGVKFELRCRPDGGAANPLIERLCACLGDLNRFGIVINTLQRLGGYTVLAQAALASDTSPFDTAQDMQRLIRSGDVLHAEIIKFLRLSAAPSAGAIETAFRNATDRADDSGGVRIPPELLVNVREASLLLHRFNALTPDARTKLLTNENLREKVTTLQTDISLVVEFAARNSVAHFDKVRDWLIERLSNSPFVTDCTLRQNVYTMVLPTFSRGERNQAQLLVGNNEPLLKSFVNYLRDCICRAMNPACAPCDDAGVLLACLEVEDCKVVKVCNLERTFVLAPASVRYWLPPLQLLGGLLERLCCEPLENLLRASDGAAQFELDNIDIGRLVSEEIKQILEDSLCLTNKNTLGPLTAGIDNMIRPRARAAARRNPASEEASSPQFQTATANFDTGVEDITATGDIAPKRSRANTSKKESTRTSEKAAEPSPAAGSKTNGGKTNGGKTNGGKIDGTVTNGAGTSKPAGGGK